MTDANDYYPFGMKHLKTGNAFFGVGSYKNHKYNGKELQETGMYSYKFRQLMIDLAQWTTPDPLAEIYPGQSSYAFVGNNPINRIDPLGLTDYKVNGEIRTINDGHTNVTMNVTERQFNRLQKRFNKGGSSYERLMNLLSDRNGYTTFSANGSGVGDGFTITKHKPGEDSYGQWSIQNNHQTYGTVEHIARVTDSSLGSVTGQFGNINVGSNNKLYFRQNTGRIFNGNQYVRTVSAASKYSKLAKGAKWGGLATGVALGGYEIYQGVQQDGGTYGYNAQVQTGGAVGGLAGGLAGAAAGAVIGTFFGGVGVVPGGIIGGLIGSAAGAWGGDYYGEKAAKAIIE
ncbi:RHS repeat-associated core domain-containing protein [Chryseobacterium aurantiacum]|uniref:RHS repeat-associated core domain-containing protein n=1 Tax=Chryseobacterium aurantiacum TaxID=2116499 RepID=UPI0021D3A10A|nr:RHS repeat-associated core domain-containing protein [Chryseobacterium aurantiacum]